MGEVTLHYFTHFCFLILQYKRTIRARNLLNLNIANRTSNNIRDRAEIEIYYSIPF